MSNALGSLPLLAAAETAAELLVADIPPLVWVPYLLAAALLLALILAPRVGLLALVRERRRLRRRELFEDALKHLLNPEQHSRSATRESVAEALGLSYLTITDHSVSATYANGLDVDRLQRQADEIARVQESVSIRLLHGTEADILQDGSLDFPSSVLERLDLVIASIHRRHKLHREGMTARLVRALGHPLFKVWGHPLGRYVLSRPPIECDMDEVLDTIAESRAAIEINGDPNRLDLPPPWIREARRRKLRFVVSTDAHSTTGLANLRWGVAMARRGWLRKAEVLNTLGAAQFAAAVRP